MDPITAIGLIAAVLAILTFFGFPTLSALWKRLRPALSSATGGVLVVDPFVEALPAYLAWLEPMKTLPINAIVDSGGGAKVLLTEVYTPQHIAVLPDLSARAAALTAKEARETEAKAAGGSIQEAQDDEAQEATDAARGDPAETERNPAEPGLHGRGDVSTRAPPTLASDDFLDRQRQAIILGDPGMGKSTLAAHRLVEALAILDDDPDAPFPIVIDIKQYVFHCGDVTVDWLDFPEYVARRGATAGWRVATAKLEERLAQKPSLVIFDGLDEAIDLVKRREMVDRIIGFAKTHERAKILLTSRIAGFHENSEDPLRAAGFLVGQLRPLSRDGVKSLASRVAEHLPSLSTPASEARAIERVMASYDQVESVRDLCGNPLLLTMMTPFAASETLPESRAKLYDKALDKLVYGWEERTAGPGDLGGKDRAEIHDILSSDDRKEMLRRAARFVSEDEARLTENLISETDLRAAFQDYLLEVKGTSRENITRRLDEAIELFRGRNRILADQGSGEGGRSFGFLHRSFLEYLTATDLENRYIKRPNQFHEVEALFRDKALVEVWREPLLLLIGLLHGEYANDAIEAALPEVVEGPDDVNRLIFALACFNELDEGTLRAVQGAARRAVAGLSTLWRIAPDDDEQGRRIWGEGDAAADRIRLYESTLGSRKTSLLKDAAEWDFDLIFSGFWTPSFSHYLVLDVDRIWHAPNFEKGEQDRLWSALRARAMDDESDVSRQIAMMALRLLPVEKTEIIDFLTSRAQQVGDFSPRRAALWTLSRIAPDDTQVHDILFARAVEDEHYSPRSAALQELARIAPEEPRVRELLSARAVEDEHYSPRSAALQKLARIAPEEPRVRELLSARAVEDEHYSPRSMALQELARIAPEEPQVRDFLRARAIEDAHIDPRSTALQELARVAPIELESFVYSLRAGAVDDESLRHRAAALEVIAMRDDTAQDFITHRLSEDPAVIDHLPGVVTMALVSKRDMTDRRLASRDVDAMGPWHELGSSIDEGVISNASKKLGLNGTEIRGRFEAMVEDGIPWRLAWAIDEADNLPHPT